MKNLCNLFGRDLVNTERQSTFDLCKAICIILMILCHVFYVIKYTTSATLNPTYIAHNIVRFFGAQFFMFSMGLGLAYTKRNDAKSCLKRGLTLLFLGYFLNFFREILPWMIFGTYPLFAHIMTYDKLLMFLSGDILQFAGLAFLFFAVVKHFKWSNLTIFITTLFITAVGTFCTNEIFVHLTTDNFYYSFIGLFIPIKNFTANDYVCFSFSNWIIYPVMGLLFGELLKRCNNLDKFYLYLFWISLPLFLLAWGAFDASGKNIWLELMNPLAYHQQNPINLAIYMNIIALAISIGQLFSNFLVKFKIWELIKHFSKELPTLYIVSWISLGWIGALLKAHHTCLTKETDNIILIFILVILISEIYIYFKNKYLLKIKVPICKE